MEKNQRKWWWKFILKKLLKKKKKKKLRAKFQEQNKRKVKQELKFLENYHTWNGVDSSQSSMEEDGLKRN